MTTIIGVQYDDKCVILADNQVTDDNGRKYSHPDMLKISEVGCFLIAGAEKYLLATLPNICGHHHV